MFIVHWAKSRKKYVPKIIDCILYCGHEKGMQLIKVTLSPPCGCWVDCKFKIQEKIIWYIDGWTLQYNDLGNAPKENYKSKCVSAASAAYRLVSTIVRSRSFTKERADTIRNAWWGCSVIWTQRLVPWLKQFKWKRAASAQVSNDWSMLQYKCGMLLSAGVSSPHLAVLVHQLRMRGPSLDLTISLLCLLTFSSPNCFE